LFDDVDANTARQVHAVARAALQAGQVELTGTEQRHNVDLLGTVLTALRPPSDLRARGQYYTPPDVAALIAAMSGVEAGTITDPMMGTGGLFRAVAATMREQGRDPRTKRWIGCDIDDVAVACAAVNSMSWRLGEDIIFHAGNTFAEGWEIRALAQREELRALASRIQVGRSAANLFTGMYGRSN
jgi:tRNA G10  N-methylase Trm11